MRKKRRNQRMPILGGILWLVLAPSKLLYVLIGVLFVGAFIFGFDFWSQYIKLVDFLYLNKAMKIISGVLDGILPK